MDPNIKSFTELIEFLTNHQIPHQVDAPVNAVELATKAPPLPSNLFLKWNTTVPFIQIIQFMARVPEDRVRDLETALVRLNHMYEVPCFGFEKETLRLYYRITVPVFPTVGISPTILNTLMKGCINAAKEFFDPLMEILKGRPGGEIEAAVAEMMAARKQAAADKQS